MDSRILCSYAPERQEGNLGPDRKKGTTLKFKIITTVFPLALVAGFVAMTLPLSTGAASILPSSQRSGNLLVSKECSGYTGGVGSFCTITSSNLRAIEVGSRIVYLQPAALFTPSGSDVVFDLPGPGNNQAFGHCSLAPSVRQCTFSGGTGKFTWFDATVAVSFDSTTRLWHWDGSYSFTPEAPDEP